MAYTYPKADKLKSRTTIAQMFTEGKSVTKYPLRLVYLKNAEDVNDFKIGVSVSKRYFKKATDRNYIKRCLREAYRLNQHLLCETRGEYQFMLLYQSADKPTSARIQELVVALFTKFNDAVAAESRK